MNLPAVSLAAKAAAAGLATFAVVAAGTVHVAASEPGDLTYGIKEAVGELRTALTSGGEDRTRRYLDVVDRNVDELDQLSRDGASQTQVDEAAEEAVTSERHAQAELSAQGSVDPAVTSRYQQHRQTLTQALNTTRQPDIRRSIRQVLRIIPTPRAKAKTQD